MFGSSFARSNGQPLPQAPAHFKDVARNAIFQQLPLVSSGAQSIRSAPSIQQYKPVHSLFRSLNNSSIFSKRSARSAPSLYSSSTATIPEDSEPVSTTIEQLVNDIQLHENHFREQVELRVKDGSILVDDDVDELYKISLGSELSYQNTPESLVDWNLNVTRCKLIMSDMPLVSSVPDFQYSNTSLPMLVGDLAKLCDIILILPHITDKELIYVLFSSSIYKEHNLDSSFRRSVAEISVKQSRLLQINSGTNNNNPIVSADNQSVLKFKYKEIAIRNYLINLAAAATTAYEYKFKTAELKKELRLDDKTSRKKLSKEDKKVLWNQVRLDVFKRAGLEE